MANDNHLEKLQHQHEAQQYFENEAPPKRVFDIAQSDSESQDRYYSDYYDRQDKADR